MIDRFCLINTLSEVFQHLTAVVKISVDYQNLYKNENMVNVPKYTICKTTQLT